MLFCCLKLKTHKANIEYAVLSERYPAEQFDEIVDIVSETLCSNRSFFNKVDGETVVLTKKEYDLLLLLILNQSIILSRDFLLDRVWGFDYDGDPRTVETICLLTQKTN